MASLLFLYRKLRWLIMKNKDIMVKDYKEITEKLGEYRDLFSGKTVLITGACGFLGKYFTGVFEQLNENFLEKPCKIIALDNFITSQVKESEFKSSKNITYHIHNVIDPFKAEDSIDFIIHLAGIASPYYYRKYPLETLETAIIGTKNLLMLGDEHKLDGFIYFSSSEIYGDPDPKHVPTKESYRGNISCLGPRACYDESKRVGETLCKIFHEQYGVPTKIVRPFNIYGPGMGEFDYRVLPNFAHRIVGNKPLQIYGNGSQTRTFCYLTDALDGFFRALLIGTPGDVYNIGNPTPEVAMNVLATKIEEVLERKLDINMLEYPDTYPPDEPMRRCPDITKARLQLFYEPTVNLSDGLKRYFDWALATYTGKD